jgi:hypothetical protein
MNSIEKLWDNLLSRDTELIQKTFKQLDKKEQNEILNHLVKITTKPGWHLEQKRSAQAAIEAINNLGNGKK